MIFQTHCPHYIDNQEDAVPNDKTSALDAFFYFDVSQTTFLKHASANFKRLSAFLLQS